MNSFNFIEARTFVPLLTYKLTQWVDLGFYSAEIFPTLYTSTQPVQTCVCQANLFSREIVSMHNLVLFGSVGCGHWVVFFLVCGSLGMLMAVCFTALVISVYHFAGS